MTVDSNAADFMRAFGYTCDPALQPMRNQLEGIRWGLRKISEADRPECSRGGVFADSEGRGKTVQALSMIASTRCRRRRCSLIVVERTSVTRFLEEIERFFPHAKFRVVVYNNNEVRQLWGEENTYRCDRVQAKFKFCSKLGPYASSFADADILLTHYACLESLYRRVGLKHFLQTAKTRIRKLRSADAVACLEDEARVYETVLGADDCRVPWLYKIYPDADVPLQFGADTVDVSGPALLRYPFEHLVLDEGHIIRNYKSNTSRMILGLSAHYRWVLTASPVYCRDADVWALLYFTGVPNLPPHATLCEWIRLGLEERGRRRTYTDLVERCIRDSIRQPADNNCGVEEVTPITRALGHKRRASAALDLCMSPPSAAPSHWRSSDSESDCRTTVHKKARTEQSATFAPERRVRTPSAEVAHSLYLREEIIPAFYNADERELYLSLATCYEKGEMRALTGGGGGGKPGRNHEELILFNEARRVVTDCLLSRLSHKYSSMCLGFCSTKLVRLCEFVNTPALLPAADKAVVFCEFPDTVRRIVKALRQRCRVTAVAMYGTLSEEARQTALTRFRDDPEVRVLALTYCGENGLNLQHANHMVFMNRRWSKEAHIHALGRCYRTGQKKDVHVTFLDMDVQIETHIRHLNEHRGQLTSEVLERLVLSMREEKVLARRE